MARDHRHDDNTTEPNDTAVQDTHAEDAPAYNRASARTDERVAEERYVRDDAVVADETRATAWYGDVATRVNAVLFAILLGVETLLALRFVLLAFGANATSGFVDFIYDVSGPFVQPFETAFANRTWDEGIIEVNTLLAMGVYLIAFLIVAMLVAAVLPRLRETGSRYESRHVTHTR